MKSTSVERDLVRNFITSRMDTGSVTRDGGNELLSLLDATGNPPILPTTPPPKPPAGRAELNVAAKIVALVTECQASGMSRERLAELFAHVIADTR
jgi:hypothetical protein